ncbi:MAG: hypothetical protein NC201_06275 [Prevotella sp.]|nr:hypothetical protein [Prevotella sp.]MCM1437187.1 hypothetical protein [Prevotella sp.]
MIICIDSLSVVALHILRGCAGLCAIVFFILSGLLVYRVNKEHIGKKYG